MLICYINCVTSENRTILIIREMVNFDAKTLYELIENMMYSLLSVVCNVCDSA